METKYKSYHTDLKIAVSLDILPEKEKHKIPKSSFYRFKNQDFSHYIGLETGNTFKQEASIAKWAAIKAVKIYRSVLWIKNVIISIKNIKKKARDLFKTEVKTKIVNAVNRVKDTIGLTRAVRYFKISVATFYNYLHEISKKCLVSVLGKCPRIWPGQLTKKEIEVMKGLLKDKRFKFWPIYSISDFAVRENLITACRNSWYKYAKIFGIKKELPESRRKKAKIGIRVDKPNLLWHADTCIFVTADNVKNYLYFVTCNFSRFILSWRCSLELSALICFDNIREAYEKYVKNRPELNPDIVLMTDGGPENKGALEDFINSPDIPIEKIVALKDVYFSNSMAEAVNKIFKYRFLFPQNIQNHEALVRHMCFSVNNYNEERPHYAHRYQTPKEVFFGQHPDMKKINKQFEEAKKRRLEENKQAFCENCQ